MNSIGVIVAGAWWPGTTVSPRCRAHGSPGRPWGGRPAGCRCRPRSSARVSDGLFVLLEITSWRSAALAVALAREGRYRKANTLLKRSVPPNHV